MLMLFIFPEMAVVIYPRVVSVFTVIENGMEHYYQPERSPEDFPVRNE